MTSDSDGPAPRRRSQIREALDAAWGTWPDDDDPLVNLAAPRRPWWRELAAIARPASRRAGAWAWGLTTAALAVVIGSLIYGWLSSHYAAYTGKPSPSGLSATTGTSCYAAAPDGG